MDGVCDDEAVGGVDVAVRAEVAGGAGAEVSNWTGGESAPGEVSDDSWDPDRLLLAG